MTEPFVAQHVQLFVTAKMLRRWAKDVEERLATAQGGDDLTVAKLLGSNCLISIIADQSVKGKKKHGNKSRKN